MNAKHAYPTIHITIFTLYYTILARKNWAFPGDCANLKVFSVWLGICFNGLSLEIRHEILILIRDTPEKTVID